MNGKITKSRTGTLALIVALSLVSLSGLLALFLLKDGSEESARPASTLSTVPTPSTSTRSPQSGSPTTTLQAPVLSKEASQQTADGSEAFFRYFIELYNYSYASLDSTALMAVSDPACKFCKSVEESVARSRSKGLTFLGGEVQVKALALRPADEGSAYLFNAVLDQSPGRSVAADGSIVDETAAKRTNLEARIEWQSGAWVFRAARTPGS